MMSSEAPLKNSLIGKWLKATTCLPCFLPRATTSLSHAITCGLCVSILL